MWTFWPPRSKGQVKVGTSPQQQHQSSRSRCEHSFSLNDLKLSGYDKGMDTYKTYTLDIIFVTSGKVIFWPAPITIISLWENRFSAYYFWTKCDRWMKMAQICLSSLQIEWYATWPILTWPDLRSNFDLDLRSNWVSFDPSWREVHNGAKSLL